jgi:hypothetical protein
VLISFAREAAGAAGAPGIPHALYFGAKLTTHDFGRDPRRGRWTCAKNRCFEVGSVRAANTSYLSPCGRGRIASNAIRVRGCALSKDRTPHPNPLPQGEREHTTVAATHATTRARRRQPADIAAGGQMGPFRRDDDCHKDDGDGEYRHRESTDVCPGLPHFVAPRTRGPQCFLQDSLACGLDRRHPSVVGKTAGNG